MNRPDRSGADRIAVHGVDRRRLLAAALLLPPAAVVAAEAPIATIDAVKAAYVYKFLGYVDWPVGAFAGDAAPLIIGVAGADAVYAELLRLVESRPPNGRPVVVRRLQRPEGVAETHLLFVGRDATPDVAAWVRAARGKPVAVVTDAPNGLDHGAVLTLRMVDDRVRFDASKTAAESHGLRLSARLLAVAERVVGVGP
jgi:hypothetical protein